jgi:hypothetical protein
VLERILVGFFLGNGGTSIVRADVFRQTGGFNVNLRYCEDWHLWCRLALLGPFVYVPGVCVLDYRVHRSNTMNGSVRAYRDYVPAIEAVFSDPDLGRDLAAEKRAELRTLAEAHMLTYSATLAARSGRLRDAAAYAWMGMRRDPLRSPAILAQCALARVWI